MPPQIFQQVVPARFYGHFFLILSAIVLLVALSTRITVQGDNPSEPTIGVVLDYSSMAGKEEIIAAQIALDDFHAQFGRVHVSLHFKNSHGYTSQAVHAASNLIRKHHIGAIIVGSATTRETSAVAEIGNQSSIPVLSLANEVPQWASLKWPFLVHAARSQSSQMKAIAAIIKSWQWRKVNVIYEDSHFADTNLMNYLIPALHSVEAEVDGLLALPTPDTSSHLISEKLETLRDGQCRVFIVHAGVELAVSVFKEAKEMGMMGNDSVWITTTDVMNYIDNLDAISLSSMQGVLGIRSHFPQKEGKFKNFRSIFRAKYHTLYPNEPNVDPGIYAVQAYDAVSGLARAMISLTGKDLLVGILNQNMEGLNGEFKFLDDRALKPSYVFELVNVVGQKGYRELGFWTEGLGFSEEIGDGSSYSDSMGILDQIFWPDGAWTVPRGWTIPRVTQGLKIGVPISNTHKEFVYVRYESGNLTISGFSIDVFRATLEQLPYYLPYEFVPYDGSYDSMVQQIKYKNFDGAVADTAIVAKRCQYAEFSQPYSESGLQIVVYVRPKSFGRTWLFIMPFTLRMWLITLALNVYNSFALWLVEKEHHTDLQGPVHNQVGVVLSMVFTVLFSLQGRGLSSNLSRAIMAVWLFLALIITSSFTANLASFLVVEKLGPVEVNVENLISQGAKVGCDGNSFVVEYLKVVGFSSENIVPIFVAEDHSRALKNGTIEASFLESPYVKVFMAKNCEDGFTTSKHSYKVGGFGFVFAKNAPYLPDISAAILRVVETGQLRKLENTMVYSSKCAAADNSQDTQRLDVDRFEGLFWITGGITTICVIFFICQCVRGLQQPGTRQDENTRFLNELLLSLTQMKLDIKNRLGLQPAGPVQVLIHPPNEHGPPVEENIQIELAGRER